MSGVPFALQLYSVRDHLAADLGFALGRVKEIGYDFVETAGTYGLSAAEFMALLEEKGLCPVSCHVPLGEVTGNTDGVIADAKTFGVEYVVMPWIGGDMASTAADWASHGAALDKAGARFREAGIRLCYHNHAQEFETLDGRLVLEILLEPTAPENLGLELDTYWAAYGGADPVQLIRKYSERCPLLHIKDMAADEARGFAEVGRGIMDWDPIFAAGAEAGVAWYIVEQDECAGDSLECVGVSAAFMAGR